MIPSSSSPPSSALPPPGLSAAEAPVGSTGEAVTAQAGGAADPILCNHCGRTASNGLSCIGACVADSGY